jgi:hypothetical protein
VKAENKTETNLKKHFFFLDCKVWKLQIFSDTFEGFWNFPFERNSGFNVQNALRRRSLTCART